MKTAIVVSGGDAPGINAAIEAYARLAQDGGDQVVGAQDGFAGLLAGRILGGEHPAIREAVRAWARARTEAVLADPDPREPPPVTGR